MTEDPPAMHRSLAFLLAVLPAAALAAASPEPVISTARLSSDIKTLSSDAFEGRGPATAGETKTVAFIIEQMKAAGLQPGGTLAGGKRSWPQDVPLLRPETVGQPTVSIGGKPLT